MPFGLKTFGDMRLIGPDGQPAGFPDKGLTAIVFMGFRPSGRVSRAELASFLWGEDEDGGAKALGNLRQLLSRVRTRQRELGATFLDIESTDITLNRSDIRFDFEEMQTRSLLDPVARLDLFLRSMTGQFLADLDIPSEAGQLWLLERRDFWLGEFASALEDAAAMLSRQNGASIKAAAARLIELDPYSDVAHQVLMRVYAKDRRLSQARLIYDRYRQQLWSELNTQPSEDMLRFARLLFNDEEKRVAAVAATPTPEREEPRPQESAASSRPRLPRLLLLPPRRPDEQHNWALMSGLIEDVTIGLCRIRTMAIVAPYTARRIATMATEEIDLLKQYDVSYVLETRLQERNGKAALYATLVHVEGDEVLWSEKFRGHPDDLPDTYGELVARIVLETAGSIERKELSKIHTVSRPTAYQNYLLGQHSLSVADLPGIRRARKFFRAALLDASEYASAIAGLARTEHLEWLLTARGDRDLLQSAEAHARDAIRIGADDAGGYHQLGVAKLYQGQFFESMEAFMEAESRAPSHADLIADHADTLVHAADPILALDKIRRAIELNPLCPDLYWWTAAGANFFLEEFGEAIACIGRMADQAKAGRLAAAAYAMLGDQRNARREMRRTLAIYPDFTVDDWLMKVPIREKWKMDMFRDGLRRSGFR
ncbi:BTAD domain-containing putative transcriptional regulator [Pleomorphomonas sp. JP5]|uniref:BTAD domain-containing putative transcriptional regulator n=1 Tax=Pleomorphomonas sp. JP5 TaxID=2942998 RepID=UPI0020441246|nr:BTAD domain-containing putative transcriptional regulator [Pleomorphomonas sp. JP5]MCM5556342.1 DNA-binding protein [Pleomorphomonas sp. JP5]